MSELAIKLDNVSKYYKLYSEKGDRLKEALHPFGKSYHKEFFATKNLSLEIKRGEILGVIGRNGCGKSTLLKLITGVLSPSSGSIKVNGKMSALLELGAGFNPEFTGVQNIYFYGMILGFTKREMDEKLDTIMEFADIGEFVYQRLKTYSSGMKARLGFAVAIHVDPEILILDEVLAVGDELFKRKCFLKMEEFFTSGRTIIYVTHSANSINKLCTRAIFMDSGQIIMDGETKLVTSFYQKYLFASEHDKGKIIDEIRALSIAKAVDGKKKAGTISENAPVPEAKPVAEHADKMLSKHNEFFIPGMVTETMTEQGGHNVYIEDVRFINTEGEVVNVLRYGFKYSLVYRLVFDLSVDSAETSFGIHDLKGMYISGVKSGSGKLLSTGKGSVFDISWELGCMILPETYYVNIAVSALGSDADLGMLKRKTDVLKFKVVDEESSIQRGIVGLGQVFNASKIK